MKKMIFAVMFLIFVPTFVAMSYSTCNESCRHDLKTCKQTCRMMNTGSSVGELQVTYCTERCMDNYDKCLNNC